MSMKNPLTTAGIEPATRKVRGVQINDAVNVLVRATGPKLCSAFADLTQHQIMKGSYNKVIVTGSVAAALSNN